MRQNAPFRLQRKVEMNCFAEHLQMIEQSKSLNRVSRRGKRVDFRSWLPGNLPVPEPVGHRQVMRNGGYWSVTSQNAYPMTRADQRKTPTVKSKSGRG